MSLFGSMRTAASGMNAQASRLGTVSDNIANVNTTGYKQASAEFETMLSQTSTSDYTSGGVITNVRNLTAEQGSLRGTSSATDLAINGNGYFVVSNDSGANFLTRAGSFVPDASGNLVNTAGYKLMGYPLGGSVSTGVAGLGGTTAINIGQLALSATPSTAATFTANLPSQAAISDPATLPSVNTNPATVTGKSSLVAYDNLGAPVTLDVYFNKLDDNKWEVSVYNKADAAPGGGFPYATAALSTSEVDFNPANGSVSSGASVALAVPNGGALTIDLSKTTQLAAPYSVIDTQMNGNSPSAVQKVEIDDDGVLYSVYENGTRNAAYKIPLANVRSPENLTQISGNVFAESSGSGNVVIGDAKTGGLGKINSSTLEQSTVDLASELTAMIESQRGYTANSKVFQTSAELVDVLVNLK
ncbi:MAG: flagellar basal body FlaE domain protein [Hyphomicrobiales bacterium]|nr:flagellar basal body FlaE domain protein [Hyphomicrobiales bacterium]